MTAISPGTDSSSLGKKYTRLWYFLFCICLLPNCFFAYKHPANSWDRLGYMAIVIRMDGVKDINEIHRLTYKAAKENVSATDYLALVDSPKVRARFANDPSYFEKVLPIYIVKPLYVSMVYLFYKTGFSLPLSTVLPSIIAYFLIGLLLFHWMRSYFRNSIAFLSALLVMYSLFMGAAAKISSPDTLSAFFLFGAFYFILEKPNVALLFVFFLLSIFTRADNLLICFFILSFLAFSGKWERKISKRNYLLMLGVLMIAYIFIVFPVRKLGWSPFFYLEYAKHMNFNRDFDQPFKMSDYFSFFFSKAITGLVNSHFIFFTFLTAIIVFYPEPFKFRTLNFDQLLAIVLVAIILVRFVLLPDLSDRFYLGFYLLIIILLIRKMHSLILRNKNVYVT